VFINPERLEIIHCSVTTSYQRNFAQNIEQENIEKQ
jgi:hypothetical protein